MFDFKDFYVNIKQAEVISLISSQLSKFKNHYSNTMHSCSELQILFSLCLNPRKASINLPKANIIILNEISPKFRVCEPPALILYTNFNYHLKVVWNRFN